jgi:hypothetical protein
MHAFGHGEPGSMKTLSMALNRHQFAIARAMNSDPFSNLTNAGVPRATTTASSVSPTLVSPSSGHRTRAPIDAVGY